MNLDRRYNLTPKGMKFVEKSEGEELLAFQLKAEKIPFEREVRFDPFRRWLFDFVLTDDLSAEVEGGIWIQGRHNRASSIEKDFEKYNSAAIRGWRVLRFSTAMVEDGRALETIKKALKP